MAELRGAPGYRYVTTPHPVAILTPDEVRARAESVLPEVVSLLTDPPHEIRTPGYPPRSEEGGAPRFRGDPGEAG